MPIDDVYKAYELISFAFIKFVTMTEVDIRRHVRPVMLSVCLTKPGANLGDMMYCTCQNGKKQVKI